MMDSALGPSAFDAAEAAGRQLDYDAAIDEVRACVDADMEHGAS